VNNKDFQLDSHTPILFYYSFLFATEILPLLTPSEVLSFLGSITMVTEKLTIADYLDINFVNPFKDAEEITWNESAPIEQVSYNFLLCVLLFDHAN